MTRRPMNPVVALVVVVACLALLAAGCAVPVRSGNANPTPSSAVPGLVAFTVSDFTDTDSNGYRDRTNAAVYLYASGYPIPVRTKGAAEFQLLSRDGRLLARWQFNEAQTAASQYDLAPGPGFIFELSLLSLGSDRLEATEGELICIFTPTNGRAIRARPSGPVQIGPLVPRSSGQSMPLGR